MREIKFRGKSLDTCKWEYGYIVMSSDKDLANIVNKKGHNEMQMNAVDTETASQFTGLLDKNGKEIYEGDVLNDQWVVYFYTGMFIAVPIKQPPNHDNSLQIQWIVLTYDACVTDNIYENPNLLT